MEWVPAIGETLIGLFCWRTSELAVTAVRARSFTLSPLTAIDTPPAGDALVVTKDPSPLISKATLPSFKYLYPVAPELPRRPIPLVRAVCPSLFKATLMLLPFTLALMPVPEAILKVS